MTDAPLPAPPYAPIDASPHTAQACVNIGPAGIRRRANIGYVVYAIGAAAAVALIALRVPVAYRLAVFLPFVGAGYSLFQARAKT